MHLNNALLFFMAPWKFKTAVDQKFQFVCDLQHIMQKTVLIFHGTQTLMQLIILSFVESSYTRSIGSFLIYVFFYCVIFHQFEDEYLNILQNNIFIYLFFIVIKLSKLNAILKQTYMFWPLCAASICGLSLSLLVSPFIFKLTF